MADDDLRHHLHRRVAGRRRPGGRHPRRFGRPGVRQPSGRGRAEPGAVRSSVSQAAVRRVFAQIPGRLRAGLARAFGLVADRRADDRGDRQRPRLYRHPDQRGDGLRPPGRQRPADAAYQRGHQRPDRIRASADGPPAVARRRTRGAGHHALLQDHADRGMGGDGGRRAGADALWTNPAVPEELRQTLPDDRNPVVAGDRRRAHAADGRERAAPGRRPVQAPGPRQHDLVRRFPDRGPGAADPGRPALFPRGRSAGRGGLRAVDLARDGALANRNRTNPRPAELQT
jgi:hypothetical protein